MVLEIGLAEDRTGGKGCVSGRDTTITAAPFHRSDGNIPNLQKHKAMSEGDHDFHSLPLTAG